MPMPCSTISTTTIDVDPNRPENVEHGSALAVGLIRRVGIGDAIGVLLIATEQALSLVLHQESPLCEANIVLIERLLDALATNVLAHKACAKKINYVPKHPTLQ